MITKIKFQTSFKGKGRIFTIDFPEVYENYGEISDEDAYRYQYQSVFVTMTNKQEFIKRLEALKEDILIGFNYTWKNGKLVITIDKDYFEIIEVAEK